MAVPVIQNAFTLGEVSPSLFGRTDLARYHVGASTMRNMFVSYRGGSYSRAGTAFVGYSKQTGRGYPPRLITYQFSINQGLALEFGHQYLRFISKGGFVTETGVPITGITNASPAVVSVAANGVLTAVAVNSAVTSSYEAGELITLAGGTAYSPCVLLVTATKLLSLAINFSGDGVYAPGDTVNLAGGTQTVQPVLTVTHTQVVSATIIAGGSGGTNGTQIVTGTTGTGTKFTATVTIAGGTITTVNSIQIPGDYTVNPTTPTAEPVTGAGLIAATLNIGLGIKQFSITNPGSFTINPPGGNLSQGSTSGSGLGATFNVAVLGIDTLSISSGGSYSVAPSSPASQQTTTGSGVGATFTLTTGAVAAFSNGDWVYLSGVGGMTQINGLTVVVHGSNTSSFQAYDVFGNPIDATLFGAYTTGGTAARIYTIVTPYSEVDLDYLKVTQSADVMSICCVNQLTGTEYPPFDLSRFSNTNWVLSQLKTDPGVLAPGSVAISASGTGNISYRYSITSVSSVDGTESVASPVAAIDSAVNIAATAGTITLTWSAVPGINQYNIYKASPGYSATPPVGALFGYAGSAYGPQFLDSNIVPDFAQVPPQHQNPFSRGQILSARITNSGTGYGNVSFVINTSTGSGAQLEAVLIGTVLAAIIVKDPGKNYAATDTVTVYGDGSGAAAVLVVAPVTGTYPSVPSYFQERRVYANTLNNPDTYWMSQPGAFTNFDKRIPTIDTDSISGSPWSVEVNGIQFMVPMPGGLVALTGLQAWQLTGSGGSSLNPQPITPSTQQAQPQAYNGCSATVPPIRIDYDIIYVQAKGSIVRDLSYQFYTNIYTGTDLTLNSSHLFIGYTIREWAWCEEPYKIIWAVRNDGALLSNTFLKAQEVFGWARHDTQGAFWSVCSVTEPPVDALYVATSRSPGNVSSYMIERMDNRIWSAVENCWCVDCGLALSQPTPNATLQANSASGAGRVTGVTGLVGGQNYSASTTVSVVDNNGTGPGTGAVAVPTIAGGVITGITLTSTGANYLNPSIAINDPSGTGSGASAIAVLDNSATFAASAGVFSIGDVGSVIRMGGGTAVITFYNSSTSVLANIISPIVSLVPNSGGVPQPQAAGNWTLTAPVTKITGLRHLAGATVTGIADGQVIPPTVVAADGSVTLGTAVTSAVIGLKFQAQLQSLYLDAGEPTVQGQRKKIAAVTARIEASRGLQIGTNQPDGSTLSPPQLAPPWNSLVPVPDKGQPAYLSSVVPLYTGDVRIPVDGGYATPGQVCLQQDNPLPMQVIALINEYFPGDTPSAQFQKKEKR